MMVMVMVGVVILYMNSECVYVCVSCDIILIFFWSNVEERRVDVNTISLSRTLCHLHTKTLSIYIIYFNFFFLSIIIITLFLFTVFFRAKMREWDG